MHVPVHILVESAVYLSISNLLLIMTILVKWRQHASLQELYMFLLPLIVARKYFILFQEFNYYISNYINFVGVYPCVRKCNLRHFKNIFRIPDINTTYFLEFQNFYE